MRTAVAHAVSIGIVHCQTSTLPLDADSVATTCGMEGDALVTMRNEYVVFGCKLMADPNDMAESKPTLPRWFRSSMGMSTHTHTSIHTIAHYHTITYTITITFTYNHTQIHTLTQIHTQIHRFTDSHRFIHRSADSHTIIHIIATFKHSHTITRPTIPSKYVPCATPQRAPDAHGHTHMGEGLC